MDNEDIVMGMWSWIALAAHCIRLERSTGQILDSITESQLRDIAHKLADAINANDITKAVEAVNEYYRMWH